MVGLLNGCKQLPRKEKQLETWAGSKIQCCFVDAQYDDTCKYVYIIYIYRNKSMYIPMLSSQTKCISSFSKRTCVQFGVAVINKLKTAPTEEICLLVGGCVVTVLHSISVHHSREFLQQVHRKILCV